MFLKPATIPRTKLTVLNDSIGHLTSSGIRLSLLASGLILVYTMRVLPIAAQTRTGQTPVLAEQVFKNVQVLRGIPVDEFMDTMGFISASTGLNCVDCHTVEAGSNWTKYADDTPIKQTARKMILMVDAINKTNFGGRRIVSCYTCHRVSSRPDFIPSLAEQYTVAPPKEPYEVEEAPPGTPTAQETLDKFLKALGGSASADKLTSFLAKGTYSGYETEMMDVPVDIFAKAPAQRTIIVHTPYGDSSITYDGQNGWSAGPEALKVLPVMQLSGGDLESAKLDAQFSFAGQIKKLLTEWRVGEPATINDADVQVLQGTAANKSPVTLYFDNNTGLLVRQVRYVDSKIGIDPLQIDYSDYRSVAGVKIPFHYVVTWVDNQSTIQLNEVRPNIAVDAARFAKPNPPASNASVPKP